MGQLHGGSEYSTTEYVNDTISDAIRDLKNALHAFDQGDDVSSMHTVDEVVNHLTGMRAVLR